MKQEAENAALVSTIEESEADAPVFKIEIHLYSGKTLSFYATKFKMDRTGGEVTRMEWEFAPRMLQPGVRCPMPHLLDLTRIEAVEYTQVC